MRKSHTRLGNRPLRAGLAVTAATAAVVAGTALPAYAAGTYVVSPTQVATAGGTPVYFFGSGTAFVTGGTGSNPYYVRFVTSTVACPATYATASADATSAGPLAGTDTMAYVTSPALAAGTYKPCLYVAASTGIPETVDTTTDTVTAINEGALSSTTGTGAANTKVTVTAPANSFSATGTFATQFVSGVSACPTTYQAADATHIVAATTRSSDKVLSVTVPTLASTGLPYLVCTYAGTVANTSALVARSSATYATYATTLPGVGLAPAGGSSGTATNILVTGPTTNPIFTGTPQVLLTRNSCPATRPTTASLATAAGLETVVASTTKISTSKLAVTVPASVLVVGGDVTTPYNVCVYASSTAASNLIASPGSYSVAPALSVTGAQFAVAPSVTAASTAAGPAQGGSTVTFSGLTGIPSAAAYAAGATLSATLGGSEIQNIVVNDTSSFTGTTTAHAPGLVKLAVTTAAGTQTQAVGGFTYTFGITVSPNSAPVGSTPVLDISGAGFGGLTFGDVCPTVATCAAPTVPAANTSYVLLTNNAWNAQTFPAAGSTGLASPWLATATAPTALCNSVLPISDAEIICTLDLAHKITGVGTTGPSTGQLLLSQTSTSADNVPSGAYTVTVVNDAADINAGDRSIVSSGSTFTVGPF